MATRVFCYRADNELASRIESLAYLEGLSEAQLSVRAMRREVKLLAPRRLERVVKALLGEALLSNHYLFVLVTHVVGKEAVEESLSEVRRQIEERIRVLLGDPDDED
jgi:glutamate/tyrosine decarboxylase-like PLP-dependent enzyme